MKCSVWSCAMVAVALAAAPSEAQMANEPTLQCLQPAVEKEQDPCILTARRDPGWEPIVVQLKADGKPVPNVTVTFSAPSGVLQDTAEDTQANGEARTVWSGGLSAPVTVTAVAVVGGVRLTRPIQIKAPDATPSGYTLEIRSERSGNDQAWSLLSG